MVIPAPKIKNDLATQLLRIFEPFAAATWIMLIGVAAIVGLVSKYLSSKRATKALDAAVEDDGLPKSLLGRFFSVLFLAVDGVYLGVYELLGRVWMARTLLTSCLIFPRLTLC